MASRTKTARLAGVLYLLVVLTGMFVLIYVPGRLYVRGDTAATASNILAQQSLFRVHITVGLLSEFLFIALVLVLYRLLKGVNELQAALMVLLVLLSAPFAFLGLGYQLATLAFLRGADALSVFDAPQREALAMLFLSLEHETGPLSQLFWGLWLLPLGRLVFRSGFLPRFLGVWLVVNGLAYVAISLSGLLAPEHANAVTRVTLPGLVGEIAFMLWLLIAGARVPEP